MQWIFGTFQLVFFVYRQNGKKSLRREMHNSFILLIIYWRFYNYFNKIYRDIIILLYSLYRQMINLEI